MPQYCAKYQYVVTPKGPKIVPVSDIESKDEESAADYNVGGYLAVQLKDTFKNDRYVVLRKLGWGHFSTVWLVHDTQLNRHSALKVVKSAGRYAETARDEIRLLRKVMAANPSHPGREFVVSILDSFTHPGPDEVHVCIIFEPLGESLLALLDRNRKKGVPKSTVKLISKQILLGLQYLHEECDLVHTDIKPENILIALPDVEAHIRAELSASPSPTCRRVGVPPSKSRPGMAIPRRARERQVQIFDSQPLASPPHSSSPSPRSLAGLNMTRIKSSDDSVATSLSTTFADSLFLSISPGASTVPTSLGSVAAKLSPTSSDTDTGEKDSPPKPSVIAPLPEASLPRPATGPSLLAQTAPPNHDSDNSTLLTLVPLAQPPITPPITIKIADLGNATPSRNHFTEDIQTRQYRSPEAILGRTDWGYTADIWSVACVVFELLCGEVLFDPKSGEQVYSRDDDHMAQIIELVGDFALDVKMGGRFSREIFDSTGAMRYIKALKFWPLKRVLMEKYLFLEEGAAALCEFLEPMLVVDHRKRASAGEMVKHPWLDTQNELFNEELL
ncbi:kinase-like protein [Rickenella mellea]|uniref:non-specific serine/threonine protein kinase n=1 Tax=Rickenella mellea TaxID=50990 RepID=A0A4Y7QM89_9AGAM|nr:kinase-like protein [Rickenella mellea]